MTTVDLKGTVPLMTLTSEDFKGMVPPVIVIVEDHKLTLPNGYFNNLEQRHTNTLIKC